MNIETHTHQFPSSLTSSSGKNMHPFKTVPRSSQTLWDSVYFIRLRGEASLYLHAWLGLATPPNIPHSLSAFYTVLLSWENISPFLWSPSPFSPPLRTPSVHHDTWKPYVTAAACFIFLAFTPRGLESSPQLCHSE